MRLVLTFMVAVMVAGVRGDTEWRSDDIVEGSSEEVIEDTRLIEDAAGIDDTLEEQEDEAEEGSGATEVTVEESAAYSMERIGEGDISLLMERVAGKVNLQMICRVSESFPRHLLSNASCLPTIYLVQGYRNCYSLPDTVPAQLLAEVHKTGDGEVEIGATWGDLSAGCVIILRPKECGLGEGVIVEGEEAEEDPEEEEEQEEKTKEKAAEVIVEEDGKIIITKLKSNTRTRQGNRVSMKGIDWDNLKLRREARRLIGSAGSLRQRQSSLTRIFSNIDLADFTQLSVGTTGAFTVVKKTLTFPGDFPGILVTKYDPWSTFPVIQLPGLSSTTAAAIVLGLIILYYGFTLAAPLPARRRVSTVARDDRIDRIDEGVDAIVRRTGENAPTQFLEDAAFRKDRNVLLPTEFNPKFYRDLWPVKETQKEEDSEDTVLYHSGNKLLADTEQAYNWGQFID